MDPTAVLGVVGTLFGVGLGSWLSAKTQRQQQDRLLREAVLEAKREAYIEYLATMRRFRRFILHRRPDQVRLADSGGPRGLIPFIEGDESYWDAVEDARSRLWIMAGYNSEVRTASDKIMDALYAVAREKGQASDGPVPVTVIDESRMAERDFVDAVRRDLY